MGCICFINIGIQGKISLKEERCFLLKVSSVPWENNATSTAIPAEATPGRGGRLCAVIWTH